MSGLRAVMSRPTETLDMKHAKQGGAATCMGGDSGRAGPQLSGLHSARVPYKLPAGII